MLKFYLPELDQGVEAILDIEASTPLSGFGGLVVSMLASGNQVRGFKPDRSRWIFGRKNPQHAFLRKGSKTVCPMSHVACPMCAACKRTLKLLGKSQL